MSFIFEFTGGFLLGKYLLGEIDIFDDEKSLTKYNQALLQFQSGNNNKALQLINHSMEMATPLSNHFLLKGLIKYDLGKYKSAIRNIEAGINLENYAFRSIGDKVLSLFILGLSRYQLEDYKNAIKDFHNALDILETYEKDFRLRFTKEEKIYFRNIIFFHIGALMHYLENHKEAINNFEKVTDLELSFEKDEIEFFYEVRGLSFLSEDKFENALNDFDKLIEINKTSASHFFNRGCAKFHLVNYKKAIKDFDKAIELGKNDYEIYFNRGLSKFNLENYEGAIHDMNYANEKNICEEDPLIIRGYSYYYLGDSYNARKNFSEALIINPSNFEVRENLKSIKEEFYTS